MLQIVARFAKIWKLGGFFYGRIWKDSLRVRVEVQTAGSLPTFKADFDGRLSGVWTSTDGDVALWADLHLRSGFCSFVMDGKAVSIWRAIQVLPKPKPKKNPMCE